MKTNKELLSSILKTTQMGQVGIRSVLDTSMRPGLRKALQSQLHEYDSIETEAHAIATQRGWELKELDPAVRMMSDMMTRMKLGGRNTDSKYDDSGQYQRNGQKHPESASVRRRGRADPDFDAEAAGL